MKYPVPRYTNLAERDLDELAGPVRNLEKMRRRAARHRKRARGALARTWRRVERFAELDDDDR